MGGFKCALGSKLRSWLGKHLGDNLFLYWFSDVKFFVVVVLFCFKFVCFVFEGEECLAILLSVCKVIGRACKFSFPLFPSSNRIWVQGQETA